MERKNGGVSSEGVLIPVPESSELFEKTILAPLQSAYLYQESQQFFKYKSAVWVKNPALEAKYNAFREKRKREAYSEEDLKESYGFLLFDDANKAYALAKTGVLTGNSTCTTLGDPSKGVYISMYSDCLDSNCWYHGKSGYIAIIRLTKGKVKKVVEIYTQNLTTPTEGFDCHVSEQLPTVSSETSSFLAFERTQYYMYERLNDGTSETAQSPSAACPFAIVSFSYTDTKATLLVPQEKSEVKKIGGPYLPWRGKLQIGSQFYSVGLRSTAGASMPSKLPPVVKIDRAISMVDLRHLLPKTVFETCFTGEAFLDGLYCSLCELFSTEIEENNSLTLLAGELNKKDAALPFPLNDGGFLILLHPSHFLGNDDVGSGSTEGLQGIFVFPDSRVAVRDVKFGLRPAAISLEKLWFLPSLCSVEGRVGKPAINSSEQLWERLVQYMWSYEAMLKSGVKSCPSKEVSNLPAEYNEQNAHKHHSSSPEWVLHAYQGFKMYLSKPDSFQLPLSNASEILAAEQEEEREDLDDDVYICLSSPEMGAPVSNVVQDQLSDKTCAETSLDNFASRTKAQTDSPPVPENLVRDDLQTGYAAKDKGRFAMHTEFGKTDGTDRRKLISLSDDLPSELIVSITSAEQSVSVDSISVDGSMSTTKHNDFKFGGISVAAKLQSVQTNSHSDETEARKVIACPQVTKLTKTRKRRGKRGRSKKQMPMSTACVRTPTAQMEKTPDEIVGLDKTTNEVSGNPQRRISSNMAWRRVIRRKHRTVAEEKTSDPEQQSLENRISVELKAGPLRKKTELWDLKPVVTECGRILVPHGSVDIAHHIKHIQEKIQSTTDELGLDKPLLDTSTNAHYTMEMDKEACPDQETSIDEVGTTTPMECRNHEQNMNSHVNPKESILEHSENCTVSMPVNMETNVEWLNKDADCPPSQTIEEKEIGLISTAKSPLKDKLKSVLLKGKRKIDYVMSEEATEDVVEDIQPCHKERKVEFETEMLTMNSASTLTETSIVNISNMLPVDVFAHALGLTPKETSVCLQRTEDQECLPKEDSPATQVKPILRQPLSISPRRRRIKTLKKPQGISEECMKKNCTPFQASPVSGSTRLLLRHQTVHGDKYKTLHSVGQEDQYDATNNPDCLKKLLTTRQKFRHSRTFVYKDGSLQVTRQWQEKYNFEPDSKFTNEMKNKAIIRALHGPWDFSIQDTEPELQVIIHMWIGLFYSRSTARFFQVDSNLTYPSSEEPLVIPSAMISYPAEDDLTDISDPLTPEALDLTKKCILASDNDSSILDLSLKKSVAETVTSDEQVSKKQTSKSDEREEINQTLHELKSPEERNESQQESGQSTEHNSDVADVNDMSVDEERDNRGFCKTVIPFIGPDMSGDDVQELHDSLQQSDVEDVVQGQQEIPLINEITKSEAVLPNAVLATSEFCDKKEDPSSPKLPLKDVSETSQPADKENQPENRCPTPTIDEKPFEYRPLGFKNADEILKNISQMSSSSSNDDLPEEAKLCGTSAVNTHRHADLEARTLRVLQSVNDFLSKSNHSYKPRNIKLTDMNESPDQTPDSTSSDIYSLTTLEDSNKRKEEKPTMACGTQDFPADSSDPNSSFKDKMEQILCVKLQVEKADLSVSKLSPITADLETSVMTDCCNSYTSVPSTECLQVDESRENQENDSLIGNSKKLKENHMANGPGSADTWLRTGCHYKSSSEKTELALLDPHQGDDSPNVDKSASSPLPVSSFESGKSSPNQFDEDQGDVRCHHSVENLEQKMKETANIEQGEHPEAAAQFGTRIDIGMIDESLILSPNTSLVCTILNTNQTTSVSFLEQISQRCLQVDPTQASVEQACLIFSEKMKQLLKKSKRGPTQQEEAQDNMRLSCASPVTIRFSNLEEQDISLYPLGTSLLGRTIMVDMSDRKDLQEQNTSHRQDISHAASNPLVHAGVSQMTAEYAQLYKVAMHNICAVEMDLPRPKCFKMDGVHPKAEPSNHFDFCEKMKREMDETFRSKLNSIVKKSCNTRYRFFILLTSGDSFFDQTKAQLEAEGHTPVDPAEFFKDSLSSLLIILRNEDIAEHIFQVPHLLELKRSPNVLFAGIDEPDDVLNLTYQDVFTAGGIIMIDKAALESLSLSNMEKISSILQELNGMGKWKWMLHYRDSRRIKENARRSTEATEKKNYLLWGQDAGILEVMPYHECDLMSRDQPDYLTCLVRLQIQNISSRHTVFITDSATDGTYERKGILTMALNSFLTAPPSETFTV